MADLGAIGRQGIASYLMTQSSAHGNGIIRHIALGGFGSHQIGDGLHVNRTKVTDEGDPQPSDRQEVRGVLKDIYWPVNRNVLNRLTIRVKFSRNEAPYPRMVAKANTSIGVDDDIEAVAVAGSDWQTLTLECEPSDHGVLHVWREHRNTTPHSTSQPNYVWWDTLGLKIACSPP